MPIAGIVILPGRVLDSQRGREAASSELPSAERSEPSKKQQQKPAKNRVRRAFDRLRFAGPFRKAGP